MAAERELGYDVDLHGAMGSLARQRPWRVPDALVGRLGTWGLAEVMFGEWALTFKGEKVLDEWDEVHGVHEGL